jgi:hypothetical protein
MGTRGASRPLHPATQARHASHVRRRSTPLESGFGWPLRSRVVYTIEANVPKPLHDAIRKGVRHWNRALKQGHIPVHYTYQDHAPLGAGVNRHVFKVAADMVEVRWVFQPPLVDPKMQLYFLPEFGENERGSHAFTEFPQYSHHGAQTITSVFFERGLFKKAEPGEMKVDIAPSGNTVLVQKNPQLEDGSKSTALVPYDECTLDEIVGVVVHEIGHAMGLAHTESSIVRTVMHGQTRELSRTRPTASDIDALRKRMPR